MNMGLNPRLSVPEWPQCFLYDVMLSRQHVFVFFVMLQMELLQFKKDYKPELTKRA